MTGRLMKGSGWMLAVALTVLLAAGPAAAGGIINKQNQSADYIRTLNRNAATDYADAAAFNPAGIMQMEDGMYGKLDVMYFDKDYSNDVPGFGELDQTEPTILPGLFTVYKQKKWAGFFAFTIPAGGGQLDYKDGNARTVALASGVAAGANSLFPVGTPANFLYSQIDAGEIEVKESTVYGFTLGASYAFNDVWSIALGTRYSNGVREFDGQATISADTTIPGINDPLNPSIHLEEDADGWAGIVGVNFAPNDKLNAALTFISNTKMEYKMDVKRDTLGIAPAIGFADGSKRRIDIPGLLGFGISYRFLPELKVDFNYTYYLEKDAEIDTYEGEGNSWDMGISAEYTFNPQWKASIGYLLTDIKVSDNQQINEPEEPKLDANTFSAGVVWSPTPDWAITLGGLYAMYDEVEDDRGIEYDKTVWSAAVGIQYRFF
ncbi:MAG: OmpP1/FadL family transporter [Desulfobacterales bacterium]